MLQPPRMFRMVSGKNTPGKKPPGEESRVRSELG